MNILKFNENLNTEKRVFKKYDRDIKQYLIDSFNNKGYKLYYYKDFNLIEITKVKNNTNKTVNSPWGEEWDKWSDIIFFLNDTEYENAMKLIKTSKELYDQHIESANKIAQMPMSHIYHNILKLS